ncbi:AcrR family transcriptional regulator [Actinoalloteichus hoggarensis]|uniref:DNA-binding transcriptional repressor AcrR n=1 Tax=Actinoalloteichus hoggarensis TaxID=1470176 RepID=A0A221W5D3_9PSEU|nr:TetR/AcrR family transcriptional regulator [Actinoalloteichus hoggarensis]ASO20747.1 DNA-binding transcriptional repressor AcrR [Actinoalloteichus hoggarensis]MBB5920677.1 AcrR family transcriptional regulator [Actinoalloteichus hoggarensis]
MPVPTERAGAADVESSTTVPGAGRPPLRERRRQETRLEIARQAVRLFAEHGVAATGAEDVAAAAGVSLRTFWRHTATKEACVRPLLTHGLELLTRGLSRWRPGADPAALVDEAAFAAGQTAVDVWAVLNLVRLTRTEPALRAVWLTVHDEAELVIATALCHATGLRLDDLRARVRAAMISGALRTAVEHHAWESPGDESAGDGSSAAEDAGRARGADLVETVREALRVAVHGLGR